MIFIIYYSNSLGDKIQLFMTNFQQKCRRAFPAAFPFCLVLLKGFKFKHLR